MPDTTIRTEPDAVDHALSEPVQGNGWIAPAVGAVVLTVLWAAYLIPDVLGILSTPGP